MRFWILILSLTLALIDIPLQATQWIAHPLPPHRDYSVQLFRKQLQITDVPRSFVIHITADNRYQLFLNGQRIGEGPARSPLNAWEVDRYDLAPYLIQGNNQLAVSVWNCGTAAGLWQQSARTGLMITGDGPNEQATETSSEGWLCHQSRAFQPLLFGWTDLNAFYGAGPGEYFDSRLHDWNWQQPDLAQNDWVKPIMLGDANAMQLHSWIITPWLLKPRTIPQLQRGAIVKPIDAHKLPIKILPHQNAKLLLDMGEIVTAFPEMSVSGGKDAKLKLTYAESLFKKIEQKGEGETVKITWEKGNRNETEGKVLVGISDLYVADGSPRRWSPLYWRCWRYLDIEIETAEEELNLEGFQAQAYGYPFVLEASIETGDPKLQKIWEIGWRTLQRCSNETFFDCPYYEQLNYAADARIAALVAYIHTRDSALAKRSIDLLFSSTGAQGLMYNRSPTHVPQYLPTWSLDAIQMLYELWMWRGEEAFIQQYLNNVHSNLEWFQERIDPSSGLIRPLEWNLGNSFTVPPAEWNGPIERISLEYLLALRVATRLEQGLGSAERVDHYLKHAETLAKALKNYWRHRAKVKDLYLEQVIETYAILAEIISPEERKRLLQERIHKQKEMTLENSSFFASYYWLYFFHEALYQNGMADQWLETLGPWKQMLKEGLTTWAESYPPTRSDCHVWSCGPSIHLFTTFCGIRPTAPGFRDYSVKPSFGGLKGVRAKVPRPDGGVVTIP